MNNLIQSDPSIMMGKPVIVGTRITVELILEKLAAGESIEQIVAAHPRLTRDHILAAIDWHNGRSDYMQGQIRAVVNEGRIEPLEKLDMPDGTEVLVTALSNGDDFWLKISEQSLNAIWDNPEDDVYAELLER